MGKPEGEVNVPEIVIGEEPPDKGVGSAKEEIVDVDDLVENALGGEESPKKGEKAESGETDDKKGGEPKGKEPAPKKSPEILALEQRLTTLETKKKNLEIALHKERQAKKATPKEEEAALTDDQLKKIMEENPDPDTQLRVMRYMAQQVAKGAKKDAIDEVTVSAKAKQMNAYLLQNYPALADESSDMRTEVDATKEALGFTDHPYGDYIATGVRVLENLPDILKQAYEKGKVAALGEGAEAARKAKIKGEELTPGGKRGGSESGGDGLTASQKEAAKRMGLRGPALATYTKLVGRNARSITVEG